MASAKTWFMARNSRGLTAFSKQRQCGLRGPAETREEIAAHPQLLDRIVRQPGGVAAVGVVGAQPKDPLEQLDDLVSNLACLPRIVGRVWRSGALFCVFRRS